jgi:peptidyl-tRNA hydrolase
METPILYVILNKELNMSAGKAAAQTAHAVASLGKNLIWFGEKNRRTVVVLQAENQSQMENLWEYLNKEGLKAEYYIDEGENEVPAYSMTAMAVEPFYDDDRNMRAIFEGFRLFNVRTYKEELGRAEAELVDARRAVDRSFVTSFFSNLAVVLLAAVGLYLVFTL